MLFAIHNTLKDQSVLCLKCIILYSDHMAHKDSVCYLFNLIPLVVICLPFLSILSGFANIRLLNATPMYS